jgi:hypothetical protein
MNRGLDSDMSHMAGTITNLQLGEETRCPYRCPNSHNSVGLELEIENVNVDKANI